MTWWSEQSAVPRFVLAKSAIHCRFVDRFAGSRAPSLVSFQWFSPRGVSLPSLGSRRARFPAVIGNMKALRLPACACLLPYLFRSQVPRALHCSCSPWRSRWMWRSLIKPGTIYRPVSRIPACRVVDASRSSQVSWRPIPCLCRAPRPRPSLQDLTC